MVKRSSMAAVAISSYSQCTQNTYDSIGTKLGHLHCYLHHHDLGLALLLASFILSLKHKTSVCL